MRTQVSLLAAVLGLGLALASVSAHAVSCLSPYDVWNAEVAILPADGSTEVPTNTLVWARIEGTRTAWASSRLVELSLEDELGAEVPLTEVFRVSDDAITTWVAFSTPEPLAPETTWTARFAFGYWDPEWEDTRATATSRFTTGTEADEDAPGTPTEVSRELHSGAAQIDSPCSSADYGLPDRAAFVLAGEGPFGLVATDEGRYGRLGSATVTPAVGMEVVVAGTFQPGGVETFRFGAMDLAGNVSEWSDPVEVVMPLAGCSRSEDAPVAGFLVLIFGLAMSGRRLRGVFLVVLALGTLVSVPPAAAGSSAGVAGGADVPAWAVAWDRRLDEEARVLGGLAVGGGAITLGISLALPFRPPHGVSALFGSTAGWGPMAVGFATVSGIRLDLRSGRTPAELVRRLEGGFVSTAVGAGLASGGCLAWGLLLTFLADNGGGLLGVMMSIPAALLVSSATFGINLERARRIEAGRFTLSVGPRVVAAGPTVFVLVF
jgi:hypothetical protein